MVRFSWPATAKAASLITSASKRRTGNFQSRLLNGSILWARAEAVSRASVVAVAGVLNAGLRGLAIRARAQYQPMYVLDAPAAVDEFRGQPIEQIQGA